MTPTLENDVRKAVEDGDAFYALIQENHRGITSLGQKLKEFRDETAGNFASLRSEMVGRFSQIDDRFAQMDDGFSQIDDRFAQVDSRFAQVDSRFAQVDSRFAQVDSRFAQVDSKLDLIVQHLGIGEK